MFYSSFGMLALVIHAIINFDILINPKKSDYLTLRHRYRAFLISAMVYYFADIMWGIM